MIKFPKRIIRNNAFIVSTGHAQKTFTLPFAHAYNFISQVFDFDKLSNWISYPRKQCLGDFITDDYHISSSVNFISGQIATMVYIHFTDIFIVKGNPAQDNFINSITAGLYSNIIGHTVDANMTGCFQIGLQKFIFRIRDVRSFDKVFPPVASVATGKGPFVKVDDIGAEEIKTVANVSFERIYQCKNCDD